MTVIFHFPMCGCWNTTGYNNVGSPSKLSSVQLDFCVGPCLASTWSVVDGGKHTNILEQVRKAYMPKFTGSKALGARNVECQRINVFFAGWFLDAFLLKIARKKIAWRRDQCCQTSSSGCSLIKWGGIKNSCTKKIARVKHFHPTLAVSGCVLLIPTSQFCVDSTLPRLRYHHGYCLSGSSPHYLFPICILFSRTRVGAH